MISFLGGMVGRLAFSISVLSVSSLPALAQAVSEQETLFRMWTSQVGTKIEARLKAVSGAKITLEKEDGTLLEVPLASLSPDDQAWVARQVKPAQSGGTGQAPGRIVIPADFPVDGQIEATPLLKRRRSESWTISFADAVTKKQVSAAQLKGKVVFVHSLDLSGTGGASILRRLKSLHEKYAQRGFEVITLQTFLNPPDSAALNYTRKAVVENAAKLRQETGANWPIMIHDQGWNPLAEKLSGQRSIRLGWLIDPEGKLLHSNVIPSTSMTLSTHDSSIPLAQALSLIFPE